MSTRKHRGRAARQALSRRAVKRNIFICGIDIPPGIDYWKAMFPNGQVTCCKGLGAVILALALAMAAAAGWLGCSGPGAAAPASVADDIPAVYAANLRKKMGLLPIQVETTFGDPYTGEMIGDLLTRAIREECPEIRLLRSGDDGAPPELDSSLPRTGDDGIDNFELAMMGRKLGLNAVMAVFLTSISADEKPTGFWFFKRMRYTVRGEVLIDIYDTETATKLLSRTVGAVLEIDALEIELIRARNRIESYLIEEVVEKIVAQAPDPVCDALDRQVWKSYVASSNGGTVRIASGKRSGLRSGHVLDVYASGPILEGVNGHRYMMPGPKLGEVKVKTATDASAQAVALTEDPIPAGSMVKIKD
jgi:hypothetical protein